MILHLMNDRKVTDRIINYFEEALPDQNKFIILMPSQHYECEHVSKNTKNAYFVVYNTPEFRLTVGEVSQYREITLHYLDKEKINFVLSIKHSTITWFEWGGDLYNALLIYKGYVLFNDLPYLEKNGVLKKYSYFYLHFISQIKMRLTRMRAIKKMKYFCSFKFEFDLLLKYYPEFKHLQHKDFFYYPIDDILVKDNAQEKKHIILGNSAALTGNHICVLKKLQRMKILKTTNVYVPLSYGSEKYKELVIEEGNTLIPGSFVPILNFMSLEQYHSLLQSCNIFIYANLRQEAFGNIIVALYIGGKVFLDFRNPLFHYLKDLGFIVFDLNKLKESELLFPLNMEFVLKNRELAVSLYNKKRLLNLIKKQFEN